MVRHKLPPILRSKFDCKNVFQVRLKGMDFLLFYLSKLGEQFKRKLYFWG